MKNGCRFDVCVPITKAMPTATGGHRIVGIATDHKRDVDREIIKASSAPWTLDYLREAGCLNWNHSSDIIGPVLDADFIDADSARRKYQRPVEGIAAEVMGEIHPRTGPDDPYGLREAHRLIKVRHPLFFSFQGVAARKDPITGEVIPALFHQVAVTPQPRNTNCACIVKSFGEMADALAEYSQDQSVPEDAPVVYVMKALDVTGVVPQGGTSGGDALKIEHRGHGDQHCSCGRVTRDGDKYCANCGTLCKSLAPEFSVQNGLLRVMHALSFNAHGTSR